MCSDRLNNSMDFAQQRDIDIDRPSLAVLALSDGRDAMAKSARSV